MEPKPIFFERLSMILPKDCVEHVVKTFSAKKALSIRLNGLKGFDQDVSNFMRDNQLYYENVPWMEKAYILKNADKSDVQGHPLFQQGVLYIQSLSSMLVPVILGVQPGDTVLDLCAAPGSKTSQVADMMNNQGSIVCVEPVQKRFYRLKSVLDLMGVENVTLKRIDGRRYRPEGLLFDKIVVDAPCSSEGRFHLSQPKSFAYWSLRKIKEMRRKQKGLLWNVSRFLKPGGVLVYSTCTFAPEENESVVDWFLRKSGGGFRVEYISPIKGVETYPAITTWNARAFDDQVKHCVRILPSNVMDGFFITKLVKSNS